jgi:hypothetical protein
MLSGRKEVLNRPLFEFSVEPVSTTLSKERDLQGAISDLTMKLRGSFSFPTIFTPRVSGTRIWKLANERTFAAPVRLKSWKLDGPTLCCILNS